MSTPDKPIMTTTLSGTAVRIDSIYACNGVPTGMVRVETASHAIIPVQAKDLVRPFGALPAEWDGVEFGSFSSDSKPKRKGKEQDDASAVP